MTSAFLKCSYRAVVLFINLIITKIYPLILVDSFIAYRIIHKIIDELWSIQLVDLTYRFVIIKVPALYKLWNDTNNILFSNNKRYNHEFSISRKDLEITQSCPRQGDSHQDEERGSCQREGSRVEYELWVYLVSNSHQGRNVDSILCWKKRRFDDQIPWR